MVRRPGTERFDRRCRPKSIDGHYNTPSRSSRSRVRVRSSPIYIWVLASSLPTTNKRQPTAGRQGVRLIGHRTIVYPLAWPISGETRHSTLNTLSVSYLCCVSAYDHHRCPRALFLMLFFTVWWWYLYVCRLTRMIMCALDNLVRH